MPIYPKIARLSTNQTRISLFAWLGVQKVKSASDCSITVPGALGNASMHSNDAHKQTKSAMAEGSVSSSELFFPSIFAFIAEEEPDNEGTDSIIASLPPDFAFDDEPQLTYHA